MKKILIATITLIFLSACGQSSEEKQKQKLDWFMANFAELAFPVESTEGQIADNSILTEIDSTLLDLFTDTTNGFSEYGGIRHFGIRHAYVGKISLPEKSFDILFVFQEHNDGMEGFPIQYMLYTFSKTGDTIASMPFAYTLFGEQYKFYSDGKINKNLEIETSDWEKEWDFDKENEPDNFTKLRTEKYKINDDGTIILVETIETEKKVKPETVLAFLKQFDQEYIPCILNEKNIKPGKILRLKGFDFLKKTFPQEILYTDFDKNIEDELPRAVLKLQPQENYYSFVVYYWDNGDKYVLYTLLKNGEIIDQKTVMASSGTDGETISLETSLAEGKETTGLTTIESHYYNNRDEDKETVNETMTQYEIDKNGKINKLTTDKLSATYYKYDEIPSNFYLTNTGIGDDIKLGQKISEIRKRPASMTTGILYTDYNQGEFYAIYNEDLELMFRMPAKTIYQININSRYKTEKGIGVGSTFEELKNAYSDITAELGQTEGDELYLILKVKDIPSFEILIDAFPSDPNNWDVKSDKLINDIPDTAKITKMSISNPDYY